MKFQFFRNNRGITFGVLSLLLFGVFILFPVIAEWGYRNTIFQIIRVIFDFTVHLLPFPITVFLIPFLLFLILAYLFVRKYSGGKTIVMRLVNLIGFSLAIFLWIWGFNYSAPSAAQKLLLKTDQLTSIDLLEFGLEVNKNAAALRKKLDKITVEENYVSETEVRQQVENVVGKMGVPVIGRVRCRILKDRGLMRRMGVAGIYFPFSAEGLTNDTYLSVTTAFIMAHEMSHGYGITDEGEADLVAYLALTSHGGDFYRYAADLELLRNIRGKLRTIDPEVWESLKLQTDSLVDRDLLAIYRNGLSYTEYLPGVQEKLNDIYLTSLGVKGGTDSYDSFLNLVHAHRYSKTE